MSVNLKRKKKAKPFKVVADSDKYIKRKNIAERLDDMDPQQVGNNVRAVIHTTDYNLYHRTDDGYGLSFLGEYLKKHYIKGNSKKDGENQSDNHNQDEESSEGGSGQKSIGQEEFFNDVSE